MKDSTNEIESALQISPQSRAPFHTEASSMLNSLQRKPTPECSSTPQSRTQTGRGKLRPPPRYQNILE
jgi:hypothetical protein